MNRKSLTFLISLLLISGLCYSQTKKLKWGISAPILSTTDSRELALSRNLSESYMLLLWGGFYYDKNDDVTPNQDLFENFSYAFELELRKAFMTENRIRPYIGIGLKNGYRNEEYKTVYPEGYPIEYVKTDTVAKQLGMSLSFGAEFFITRSISIFAHTNLFYLYHNWEDGRLLYPEDSYHANKINKTTSIKMKGFERSTLYVRFYF